MPTTQLELTGISCHIASRIIDAGVDQVQQLFSEGDAFNFRCIANEWNATAGSIVFGQVHFRPPEWMGFVVIYLLCVVALLASLHFLRRKGATTREFFYWGALAMIVPFLGPLATLIFYRFAARNHG